MASNALDQLSSTGVMVSSGQPSPVGSNSTIGQLSVSHSGESIIFAPEDAQGVPLTLTALRSTDDAQIMSIGGVAQSSSITLRLGNQTTAPIALYSLPPLTSFLWTATLPQAGPVDIGLAYAYSDPLPGGHACSQALIEVFDSGNLVGSVNLDQTKYPDPSVDIGVPGIGVFKALGTFAFATTSLLVRISGAANSGALLAGMLRMVPHGSTDPAAIGYIDPSPNRAAGSDGAVEGHAGTQIFGSWTLNFYYTPVGNWHGIYYAAPTGTQSALFPKQNELQNALLALPNVPAGSVAISAPSNQLYQIHFTGALSGQALPTLVCSDPALVITHDNTSGSSVGGQYPLVTINGVDHPLRAASFAIGKPLVVFHLIQDAPDVQYLRFGEGLFQATGYYTIRYGAGYGGQVGLPSQAGPVATWRFQGLPGVATYQVAITWPQGDPNADILQCVIQDGSGNTLATVSGIDQSQAPNDFQDGGVGWKTLAQVTLPGQVNGLNVVAVGGNPQANKHLLLDSVRLARVGAPQAIKIQPTDQVLFSAPAGFIATNAGPIPAANQLKVAPASAKRLPPLPGGPKTLKLGVNCDPPSYYGNDSCFSNLAIQANVPVGLGTTPAGNPARLGFDGRFGLGAATTLLTQPPGDAGGRGLGTQNTANGLWVVQWQGSSWNYCQILTNNSTTSVTEDVSRRVQGTLNRRYYQVQDTFNNAPSVAIGFFSSNKNTDGSYACDISDVAVYPADVDPNQTSRWRPGFLQKLKGMNCFRFMDFFGTNNLNLSKFEHFPDPANFPLGYANRRAAVQIQSIGPPTPDAFAENVAGTVIRVTTRTPHGLTTGFNVMLQTNDGTSLGQIIGDTIDPRTGQTTNTARDPIDPTDGYNGQYRQNMCHVVDATTLQIGVNVGSGPLARMVNTLTPASGFVIANIGPGAMMAPSDAAELCAETGLEPWVNVPWLADDDCVTRMAQAFAAQVPRGTMVHVEYGNEAWNYAFSSFFYCVWLNNLNGNPGINYVPAYVARMAQVHTIFQNVWTQAGRNVAEVRRVCGTQFNNYGGTTVPIVQYALANAISFDELAPATYYSNEPASGPFDDLLTREQLLDLFAVNLQQSDTPGLLAQHLQVFKDALAKNPSQTWLGNVVLVNYEGGPDTMTTATMSANLANKNQGVHRDPDFAEIESYHLQLLENAGVKLFNIFTLYGTRGINQWGVYEGSAMQPGTGDASIDTANRDDFQNLPAIKSETAAALNQWSALRSNPIIPRRVLRNGTPLSTGIPAY